MQSSPRIEVAALFREDEELAQALSGFEVRPGQIEMAEAVERALGSDRALFVEAGTGTGKTLAYLLAAGLSGKKIVISTATNALLRQIVEKDVPVVQRVLGAHGIHLRVAEMKGLGNYLCRRRLQEARLGAGSDGPIARIAAWALASERGDRSELTWLPEGHDAWADVASSPDTRIGATCTYFEECFVTRMRRDAEAADIIVTNHHLFFADLALRRGGGFASALPPYDAVIFDEAHKLEDIATDFFGFSVSNAKLARLARDAEATLLAADLSLMDVQRASHAVEIASERFFEALPRGGDGDGDRAVFRSDALGTDARNAYFSLDTALDTLCALALTRTKDLSCEKLAGRIDEVRAMLARICDASNAEERSGGVCWISLGERSVRIGTSPVEIGPTLSRLLFERVPSTILTSATLATGKETFAYVKSRLGAPADAEELSFASPFDYPRTAGLYVADDLPEPRDARYEALATARLLELVAASGGGAFVLTTSHRMRARFARALRGHVRGELIVQGELPKEELLSRFRAREDNVLVATMGFWEGVDVRGRALRLVVLDKIPFAVPTDPLTMFRAARLEAEGKSPFADHALPEAALSLKQGFGRLIRSSADSGVVAVMDSRLATKGYGKVLQRALPPARRLVSMDEVKAFFAEKSA
jgi:ATP-dependent DNA helicase DinG